MGYAVAANTLAMSVLLWQLETHAVSYVLLQQTRDVCVA